MEVAREEEAVVEEIAGDCLVPSLLIAPVLLLVWTVSSSNLGSKTQAPCSVVLLGSFEVPLSRVGRRRDFRQNENRAINF